MITVSTIKLTSQPVRHFLLIFQIDELHHHNQNLVGTLHATSLLWSTNMKTAVLFNLLSQMITVSTIKLTSQPVRFLTLHFGSRNSNSTDNQS